MTSIPCFLVERRNEHVVHVDSDRDPEGWDQDVFDIVRVDSGEVVVHDAKYMSGGVPVGAMWFSDLTETYRPTGPDDWSDRSEEQLAELRTIVAAHPQVYPDVTANGLPVRSPSHTFVDGPHLMVRTPGGPWNIDSRASNCGAPWDYEHRCWVRHGQPPALTVDKDGLTCSAGAGSIQCGDYHGFLRDGALT